MKNIQYRDIIILILLWKFADAYFLNSCPNFLEESEIVQTLINQAPHSIFCLIFSKVEKAFSCKPKNKLVSKLNKNKDRDKALHNKKTKKLDLIYIF